MRVLITLVLTLLLAGCFAAPVETNQYRPQILPTHEPSLPSFDWDAWAESDPIGAWRMEATGDIVPGVAGTPDLEKIGNLDVVHSKEFGTGLKFDGNRNFLQSDDNSLAVSGDLTLFIRLDWSEHYPEASLFRWGGEGEVITKNALYSFYLDRKESWYYPTYVHEDFTGDNIGEWGESAIDEDTHDLILVRDASARTLAMYVDGEEFLSWHYPRGPSGGELGQFTIGHAPGTWKGQQLQGIVYEAWMWDNVQNPATDALR